MKKILIVFFSLSIQILYTQGTGTPLKFKDGYTIDYDIILNSKIDEKVELSKLFEISSVDFNELDAIGKPSKIDYKNHMAYESWTYYYENLLVHFQNTHGKIELVNLNFAFDSQDEHKITLGNVRIDNGTSSSMLFRLSEKELSQQNSIKVINQVGRFDIQFKIILDDQYEKVIGLKLTRNRQT